MRGLDPVTMQLALAMTNSQAQAPDIAQLRIAEQARTNRDEQLRLSRLPQNLGVMAPMVAGIRALAKHQNRSANRRTMDELYANYEQSLAQQQQQEALVQEEARRREAEAKELEYQRQLYRDTHQSGLRREEAEAKMALEMQNAPPEPAYDFDQEAKLRKEFSGATQGFADINDSFGRVTASLEEPSAAGDLALIFNYMKMLDPGSTVREGEFAQAAASGGYGDRLKAAGQSILSGRRLSEAQRADFGDRAFRLYKKALDGYDTRAEQFRELAGNYDARPDVVTRDRALYRDYQPPTGDPQGLQPGHVEDGFEYVGGDPADQNSWRPVQ